jgi:TonB family protein
MKSRLLAASFALLLTAFAPPPTPIPPGGAWNVDWGERECALTRHSGGSAPYFLRVAWVPGDRQLDLKWVDTTGAPFSRLQGSGLFLDPGHLGVGPLAFAKLGPGQAVGSAKPDIALLDRLASATSIRLEKDGALHRELPVPDAAKAVAGLRECHDSALREAGVDTVAYAALRAVPVPIGGVAQWVRHGDYPRRALREKASGIVHARVTVGTDGRVRDCKVIRASGSQDLDTKTCLLMEHRGRYEPAVGPDGAPAAAPALVRVVWRVWE